MQVMVGAALLLLCGVLTPTLAQVEPNVSSARVDCARYAPSCARLCPVSTCSKNKTLYIQGFVPADNEVFVSETIIPAAFAAIDDINSNCSILPDYRLELEFVNTMCDPSEATWQLISAIVLRERQHEEQQTPRIMFFGGGCSLATEPLAALAGRFYKISMLSYGASSPSLSTVEMFPNFFRTIPSEVQSNSARFALMKKFGWERVATLHETQTIFSQTVEDFHTQYDQIYMHSNTTEENGDAEDENLILRSFTDDPEIPLKQIKEKDIRIIIGYFYEDKAIATLCRAYKMDLTTDSHLWMFPAWYRPDWYQKDYVLPNGTLLCTEEELREAVKYSFFLDSYNASDAENYTTDTGSTSTTDFLEKYDCYLEEFRNNPQSSSWTNVNTTGAHAYISFTYDGVWALAFTLDETRKELIENNSALTLDQFEYFNGTPNISEAIKRHLANTNFSGVSGEVTFDKNGDRRGLNSIYQLREVDGEMVQVLLAIHDPGMEDNGRFNLDFTFIKDPLWKGDGPPRDRRTPENKYMIRELVIFGHFLTSVAVVIALALLVFNLATLWKPLIRDSAPHINTIVVVGCVVMLLGCYLLGIDSNNPPQAGDENYVHMQNESVPMKVLDSRNHRYKVICTLRLWVLTLGFTLSFGALFAKTWQVYRVYTNSELKKKEFKMWNFFIIMGILLLIDVAYLGFWTGVYPFYREVRADDNNNDDDTVRKLELCQCMNYGYLIGALYVYKGLLVVFGLFLAYESRNVKYFYINDSRFVSITMYIVVILVGIGAPLSLVLAVHYFIDAAYMLAVLMIIAACMSCLLILYIPKFYYMAKGEDTMVSENQREEITVSDGLQLGRSTVDTTDIKTAEDEVNTLQKQVNEKQFELKELQSQSGTSGGTRPRNGSDGDSGVLVTGDDNETFSTESTANGDHIRAEAGEAGTCSAIGRIDTTTPTILDEGEEPETTSDGTNV